MYVYCTVCYLVIADAYVRSAAVALHIITLLMTIWNLIIVEIKNKM